MDDYFDNTDHADDLAVGSTGIDDDGARVPPVPSDAPDELAVARAMTSTDRSGDDEQRIPSGLDDDERAGYEQALGEGWQPPTREEWEDLRATVFSLYEAMQEQYAEPTAQSAEQPMTQYAEALEELAGYDPELAGAVHRANLAALAEQQRVTLPLAQAVGELLAERQQEALEVAEYELYELFNEAGIPDDSMQHARDFARGAFERLVADGAPADRDTVSEAVAEAARALGFGPESEKPKRSRSSRSKAPDVSQAKDEIEAARILTGAADEVFEPVGWSP